MSCPSCFTGYIHLHEKPTGTMQTIYGRQTYVANPPEGKEPKGIVVIVPDAFGLPFPNNKLLADIVSRLFFSLYTVSPAAVTMVNLPLKLVLLF